MADDALKKEDLIDSEALKAFEELNKLLDKTKRELEDIAKAGGKLKTSIGSSKTFKDLNAASVELDNNINKLIKSKNNLKTASKGVDAATKKSTAEVKKNTTAKKSNIATNKRMASGFKQLRQNLFALIGVYVGLTSVMRVFRAVFDTTKELDSLNFAIKNIITDSKELAATQAFLNGIIENYGLNLVDATRSYIKFRAAVGATNLTVTEGQQIFESFAKTGAILGLRAHEMNSVFLALEQMISKGKITTEELRRQLGERIPGAFNIMANAIGVTVDKLDDMLKKGEVLAETALPLLAAEMEKTFGIEQVSRVDTLVSAQERLTTTWKEFVRELSASEKFINLLERLNIATKGIGQQFGFFLPSTIKGNEAALNLMNRVRTSTESAADEYERIRDIWRGNNEELKKQKALIIDIEKEYKRPRAFGRDAETFEKSPYGSRSDMRNAIKEGKAMFDKLLEQDRLFREKLGLGIEGIAEEREKANKKIVDEDAEFNSKAFAIFKTRQDAEFNSYKEHLQALRMETERSLREGGATELQMDRATAGIKNEILNKEAEFRTNQLSERLNFVKSELNQEVIVEKDASKVKMDIAKKNADFAISEGKKEHDLYLTYGRDELDQDLLNKDAKIAAIEAEMRAKLGSLEYFATQQSKFAKISGQQELIDTKLNKEALKVTIAGMEELLDVEGMTADEILGIEKKLFNAKVALQEQERAEYQKTFEERKQLNNAILELSTQAISDGFNIFSDFQSARMEQLEWDKDREVNLAGENVNARIAAENKYDSEKRKLERRQAIAARAQAAFDVILDTIKGVMSAASSVVTIPLIPFIKGLGAINLAAVLARPIPKYEKGGFHPGGPAEFSEGGKQEIFIPFDGNPVLTPAKHTTADMPAGQFIPHNETQRILAQSAMNNFVSEVQEIDLNPTNSILKQIANKKEINIVNGFKMTNKSNIFGRYAIRN